MIITSTPSSPLECCTKVLISVQRASRSWGLAENLEREEITILLKLPLSASEEFISKTIHIHFSCFEKILKEMH
jgi:hypothetical protein